MNSELDPTEEVTGPLEQLLNIDRSFVNLLNDCFHVDISKIIAEVADNQLIFKMVHGSTPEKLKIKKECDRKELKQRLMESIELFNSVLLDRDHKFDVTEFIYTLIYKAIEM